LRNHQHLDSDAKLSSFLEHLKDRNLTTLAVDFEGEFNLHAYGERLCLVQIFDGSTFFTIDPFAVSPELLKQFLEDRKVLKLFFGAGSDVQLVYKESKIVLNSVLDLQILAEVAGCEAKGLGGLTEELFGKVTVKKKQFQMHNWIRRPIDREALDYALSDVESLFDLHTELMKRITAAGKVDDLVRALVLKTPSSFSKGVPGIYKAEGYLALNKGAKELFEKVLAVRDSFAKDLDWPPDQVIAKTVTFDLASRWLDPSALPRPGRMNPEVHRRLVQTLENLPTAPGA
jgi:ribonuclease D